jgi:hypothetical protein
MGDIMIDENTIAHIERLRDRDKTVFNCERDHMLKGFTNRSGKKEWNKRN